MLILGIDPGFAIVGFGLVEADRGRQRLVQCGAITTPAGEPLPARLRQIADDMDLLLAQFQPQAMAVEELFFNNNITTGIGVAQARGVLLLAAERRGLTPVRIEDVEVVGARLDELRLKDFRLPTGVREDMTGMPRLLRPLAGAARRLFGRAPRVDPEKCVGCGVCRDACPVKAISLTDKKAGIDGKRCIRCYCCHELCPESAVAVSAQR